MNDFYKFVCAANDDPEDAELLIFAPIGDWEDMGEVSAKAFTRDLSKLPASVKRLDIHINSPGGSLFEASAIYSRLADHRSTKHVYVDGLAASAASIIAMVGHKIYIRANATMMIHMPSGIVMGSAKDMRSVAGALDTVTESMINVYEKRTGQKRDVIRDMLEAETWFSPEDAVSHGFADEVRGVVKAAASLGERKFNFCGQVFDLSRFRNIPANIATNTKQQKKENMKEKVTATAEGGGDPPTPVPDIPPAPAPAPAPTPPPAPDPAPVTQPLSYQDGMAAERLRIVALQKLDRPATHTIVAEAIANGKTAADIFDQVMAAMDQAANQGARRADARQLDGIPPADGGQDKENDFAARVRQKVQARRTTHARNRGVFSRN